MRNSVKLVIDAYHGSLTAYVSAPNDPLIQTWARIFPGVLQPFDSLPADLRAHIRYPDDLYRIQTTLYTTYHMDAPDGLLPPGGPVADPGGEPAGRLGAVHAPPRSCGCRTSRPPSSSTWCRSRRGARTTWRRGWWRGTTATEYGRLRVYQLPRQSLVYGPVQIENRINQDTEISRQVSLWDQRGSQVIRGDLLVIPIEESLLYVQPLYLQAEGGRIPELKRVVVAYQNQVVMRETLDGALSQMFGGSATAASRASTGSIAAAGPAAAGDAAVSALIAEARRRYEAAIQAQRDGDWARYGEEIRQLGVVLQRLGSGGS